ncbi:type VI secretion system baseplate subunit TssF [Desulfobaculum sp.]
MTKDDAARTYYQSELAYLRKAGVEFARRYPRIASRLELGPDMTPDPFVERLIESFAWLTARIRRNVDAQLPQLSGALLQVLYPGLACPLPSLSVAEFAPEAKKAANMLAGYEVPQGLALHCDSTDGKATLRWRTCWPLQVLPIKVTQAAFEPLAQYNLGRAGQQAGAVLRFRIEGDGVPLASCDFDSVRLFLHGDRYETFQLYDLLLADALDVCLRNPADPVERTPLSLGPRAIRPAGLGADELALPRAAQGPPAYQMVQEYFAFPERFLFVEVAGLSRRGDASAVDVLVPLARRPRKLGGLSRHMLRPNAVPIVNLFSRIAEPIRLDETQSEYRLVPDARRSATTEIHSIESVAAVEPGGAGMVPMHPYFSLSHAAAQQHDEPFWLMRRTPAAGGGEGTDVYLSFADLSFNPARPAARSVVAHVLCTNRHSAVEAQAGTLLARDSDLPVSAVRLLTAPTPQRNPPLGGEVMWRLVSHLALNKVSLSGPQSVEALQEILMLYAPDGDAAAVRQARGIKALTRRPVARRLGSEAWRGFVRGTDIGLTLDPSAFAGGSAVLFAGVMSAFFGLYCNVNTFSQLTLRSEGTREVWHRWAPQSGSRPIL